MTASNATLTDPRQFRCRQCGGNLVFAPGTDCLQCPHCGSMQRLAVVPDSVPELDLQTYLNQLPDTDGVQEILTVTCGSCGAETTLAPDVTAGLCPFCGNGLVATGATHKAIRPQGLLPFVVNKDQAGDLFRRWVANLWFAPRALAASARQSAIVGAYVPAWTYDADAQTDYAGARGDDYTETETYEDTDAEGHSVTRTREVTHTDWTPVSGHVDNKFDDLLVLATRSLPPKQLSHLEPWDLNHLTPYADEFLSGFVAQSYQVNLGEGFGIARTMMDPVIQHTIRRDIGGDHQRISNTDTQYFGVTFKHLLLPAWISAYRFNGRTFRFLINARTGEVQGERPYSAAKITLLILTILAIVIALVVMIQWVCPKIRAGV